MGRKVVTLRHLQCFATEDTSTDELYLTVDGVRSWPQSGIFSMGGIAPREVPMHIEKVIPRNGVVTVKLFDEDTDADDELGELVVRESDVGDLAFDFTRDEAHYRLSYNVE
ncbi:C2 domain-containing protein [Streptomyces luteogriseus]|uniref:hypothetical protein n=1 Tax=Streptomyces luteogriseus TaxID=68233 RepID=UPI0036A0A01F